MATKTRQKSRYKSVWHIFCDLAEMLRPPERLSVSEAAEKYVYLNQPGAYVGPYLNETAFYMVEPMDTFASRRYTGEIFVGPAQSGKPLCIKTPVATPSGWTTLGEISVGDTVFGDDGCPAEVNFVTPVFHDRDCYRITFDDGSEIISDGEHRWVVNDTWGADPYGAVMKDTLELFRTYSIPTRPGKFRSRYSIPNALPLALPKRELPIDPYVLGVYLGDGDHCTGYFSLGSKDFDEIVLNMELCGYTLDHVAYGNTAKTAMRVGVRNAKGESLATLLRQQNLLKNKHIPAEYLRASETQRRELLRGLLDTDGTVSANGVVSFSQSRPELFQSCLELVRSLGYKPMCDVYVPHYTYKGERLEGLPSHRLSFHVEDAAECFSLTRHIERNRKHTANVVRRPTHIGRRFIRNIEPVASVPVRCIGVSNKSHLFLVGEQMVPTHNTQSLILNTIAYSVKVDPMDMMVVCPTMTAARDFSIRRIDRLHRHSVAIGDAMLPGADADNKFDKSYSSGMLLTLSWPTPTELAGKPIGRIVLTDRDRMPDDIDGDGEPYDLASKRTTTFGSYAMTIAESSPSRPVTDLKWIPRTPHEAPPCEGILKLYNRGDRRRWYWPCPSCNTYFEGMFTHLQIDDHARGTNLDKASTVRMVCPSCGHRIHSDERGAMNQWGMWVKDGQGVDPKGRVFGPDPRNTIASFWLNGVAASFTNWVKLTTGYLDALDEFERTGSEEALKKFYNNDLGEPYLPKSAGDLRLPESLKSRAEELGERVVPEGVRFLLALIDVQKNMFVVQVFGILPGKPFDVVLIDRFNIVKSDRTDDDGERLWVKPATYLQDWTKITEEVLTKEYPLADGSGRMMGIKFTGCDSGGAEGVTTMAYNYYRALREENMHRRFILTKGTGKPEAPRCRITYPDSGRKDKMSAARGDVPVLILNSNLLKDALNGRLDGIEPGKGMLRFPTWLPDYFYNEMCAETRTAKGWENLAQERNEAWDLCYMMLGLAASELLRVDNIDWSNAPSWAGEWDKNELVRTAEAEARFKPVAAYDFAALGKMLA